MAGTFLIDFVLKKEKKTFSIQKFGFQSFATLELLMTVTCLFSRVVCTFT